MMFLEFEPSVSEYSYVDRGNLDETVRALAKRDQHIALKGESKSGKSWLRQRTFPNANVIQCRITDSVKDLYRQILANLDIAVVDQKTSGSSGTVTFEATAEVGWNFLAKASGSVRGEGGGEVRAEKVVRPIGKDEFDIDFIAAIIKTSGRKVVIEDFHYLPTESQRALTHELKTLWDYGVYVVVIGVWNRKNYLTYLNADLALRISEVVVEWSEQELVETFDKGCDALNVRVAHPVVIRAAKDSFNNIGILQSIALLFLECSGILLRQTEAAELGEIEKLEDAGMQYADQLEAVYSLFAERVSEGIRKRKDATRIYAFALWSILESSDDEARAGLSVDRIFEKSRAKQPRIQKANLRSVLRKFKELQVDDRNKGVVMSFDEVNDVLVIVDKGVLFYRKYMTHKWPWENIALEEQAKNTGLEEQA